MRLFYILCAIFTLNSCNNSIHNATQTLTGKEVEIPLGGNSYITQKGNSEEVTDNGFTLWSNSKAIFSTYFRVNGDNGSLNLYLKYKSSSESNSIQVRCKDKKFKVRLPKTNIDSIVYIGTVDKCIDEYIKVDFQGETLNRETYIEALSLFVGGEAAKNLSFVGDFSYYWGRRGPSVHMNYTIPEKITAEWFYNEVTVPKGQDPIGSYFMSNGFGEGYFGIQVNSENERRVLFSVWSPFNTDNPKEIPDDHKIILVKTGEDVKTGEFGNEGSGGQSYYVYNWEAGNTYKFLTRIRPAEKGYSEYTSYFFAPEVGQWKLIAQFLRPFTNTYYTRPHSFLENFDTKTGYITRKANYNNQWIYTKDGDWIELTNGKFTADNTAHNKARVDYKGGVQQDGFFLQNCGFFNSNTEIGSVFERKPTNNRPNIKWDELEK